MEKFLLVFVMVFAAAAFSVTFYQQHSTPLISGFLASDAVSQVGAAATPSPTPSIMLESLKSTVSAELADRSGTYSVYYRNLKNGESFSVDAHRVYTAASLYKLWVMAAVYEQIRLGTIAEDEVLSQSVEYLNRQNDIDPADADLKTGAVTMTVKTALKQMITVSHNYAALLLTDRLGYTTLKEFPVKHGFRETTFGEPKTTAFDAGLFMEKLYAGTLIDSGYSGKMLELLSNQKKTNKIPLLLPKKITVANKTGELGMYSHDAGIIYTEHGDYILVVMSETTAPKNAESVIATLSKKIYDIVSFTDFSTYSLFLLLFA
jgi:beta-lactamase class A